MIGRKSQFILLALLGFSLFLVGCSTNSVFVSYPSQVQSVRDAIGHGDLESSYKKLSKKTERSADRVLYLQERGRVSDLKGESAGSIEDYTKAAEGIEANRMKALVSLSDLGANAASLVSNDNVIPYAGHGYEKVFLHTYNALSYLELGSLEDALVEVRKANNEQKYALSLHEKEIEKARVVAQKNRISLDSDSDSVRSAYDKMANQVGAIKDSFQNAFTYYFSGVLYEADGQREDAYIDYKKALEIYPDNRFIRASVLRLAKDLGRDDELDYYVKIYNEMPLNACGDKKRRVVVIYEEGFVPEKESITVPFFWADKSYTISMPYYSSQGGGASSLHIDSGNKHLANTEFACSIGAMAVKSLMEDYNTIFLRQVLRLIAKHEIQEKASGENEYLGALMSIASVLTEKADRRSWLTLPNNIQIADMYIDEKVLDLELSTSAGVVATVNLGDLSSNTLIIRVINAGGKLYMKVLGT